MLCHICWCLIYQLVWIFSSQVQYGQDRTTRCCPYYCFLHLMGFRFVIYVLTIPGYSNSNTGIWMSSTAFLYGRMQFFLVFSIIPMLLFFTFSASYDQCVASMLIEDRILLQGILSHKLILVEHCLCKDRDQVHVYWLDSISYIVSYSN